MKAWKCELFLKADGVGEIVAVRYLYKQDHINDKSLDLMSIKVQTTAIGYKVDVFR